MKRLLSFIALFVFACFQILQAQTVQISGSVTSSEDGSSLPGVSIVVKGTTIGTVSDFNGNFTLDVPQDATTLVFSFIGMKTQEVAITGQTVFNVVMEPDIVGIDEVVVTALGITREKKSLGYSVQDVSGEDLNRANNPNILTTLSGKIAGVEVRQSSGMPGAPAQIFIRGARSFSGNNAPLYIVDGLPITSNSDYTHNVTEAYHTNRALDIDPNNIASVNVLKGQVAAALYGLRASNGVILITTKSGANTAKGRPTVNFTSSYTADVLSRFPERQSTYAQGYSGAFSVGNSYSYGPKISDLPDHATYGGNTRGQSGKWFNPYKAEWVDPVAYDNPKEFFGTGSTWYNGINVSNSTAFGNYLFGVSSTNQTGVVPNTGMDKKNAKVSANIRLGNKWTIGMNGNYSDTQIDRMPSGNSSTLFTVFGSPPSFDLMGTPYHMEGPLGKYRQISYRRGAVGENPRWAQENNKWNEATKRFFGNSLIEYNPVDWVKVKYQLGIDTYSTDNEDIYQMGSAATGQGLPASYPTPDNPVYTYSAPTGGQISNYGLTRTTLNSLLNITASRDITDDLNATLHLGNEFNDGKIRRWTMTGSGFTIPGWDNMSNTTTQIADESKDLGREVGFFGSLALDFRSMLFLNATGRYDVVSSMPRNNRSFFYPSVSLGFIFTELGPLQGNTILPYGKIRASYAEVGQAGNFQENVYVLGGAGSGFLTHGIDWPIGGVSGFKPSRTIYDPNLVPQNTANWEIGFEFKFLNNRIGIDYTYSDQTATDQIFGVPLAGSTGYGTFMTNAGKMTSQSHEIMFYANPVTLNAFKWNINANFTKVKNLVVELAEGVENISLGGYVTPNIRASAGDTYPAIYGERMARDDQGRILINDNSSSGGYGFPTSGEFDKIGDVSPDFIVGLINSFTFFNIVTLSAQLDWKQGGEMYSGSNRLIGLYGTAKFTENRESEFTYEDTENAREGAVLSDGSPNNIVRGGPGDTGATQYFYTSVYGGIPEMNIYETSFVKLRELAVTVSLPKQVIAPLRLQAASLSFIGRNFLLWTTLPNFDPETSQGMGNMASGMDYMSLPQTKSYGVALNLTF